MVEEHVMIAVSARERRILSALRDVPPGQPRALLEEVLDRLVEFVRDPHCPELQADGAPCTSPVSDCEQCARLKEIIEGLRRGLR
jgi:hypothetical protein